MPRGITPIRVRRRQSDAKWRASVAMCYNIMKNVIPNQKILGRRKVSKALTLTETERHIVNLERKLRELMEEKAPCCGKAVMISDAHGQMRCATFEDIKRDFAIKQVTFFSNSSGSGKKRYNIPADIEASLVNLSKQTCQLFVLDRADARLGVPLIARPRRPLVENGQVLKDLLHDAGYTKVTSTLENSPVVQCDRYLFDAQNNGPSPCNLSVTPLKGTKSARTAKTAKKPCGKMMAALKSPQCKDSLSSPGFTPVKLPAEFDNADPLLSLQETPARTFGSPFGPFVVGTDDNSSLLCTETIDTLDFESEHLGLTPTLSLVKDEFITNAEKSEHSAVDGPKCRRRLDISYNDKDDQKVPVFDQDLKIDSFLSSLSQYADSNAGTNTNDSSKSVAMPSMFDGYEEEKKSGLVSLDYIEDSMGLSSGMGHIDLDPLPKVGQIKTEVLENSQEVPDTYLEWSSQLYPVSSDLNFVAEYEDLGILYNKDSKEELFSFKLSSFDGAEEEGKYNQVVPSF